MRTRTTQKTLLTRAAATLLAVLLTTFGTQTAWADVTWDGGTGTATDPYYVNMPTTGTKTLDLSNSSVTTFKVYDDGGPNGNYSNGSEGFLVITAPEGYRPQFTGNIIDCSNAGIRMWEGSDTENPGDWLVEENASHDFNVTSGSRSVVFLFFTYGSDEGFDITVTFVEAPAHNINFTSVANGSVAASVGGTVVTTAKEGQTVTLTATPDDGYQLADLSVTCGDEDVTVTLSPWTNSATFTMPDGPVTVTPTFALSEEFYITIPATGVKRLSIPEGVTSFKVYDDGGPDGDYSPNCDGWLEINLPDGYHFHLEGTVTTDGTTTDRLRIYDGAGIRQMPKSDTAGEPKSFTYDFTESIRLRFLSNDANQYAGLDLTVTLVGAVVGAEHSVTVNNADTSKGTVTASVGGEPVTSATAGQTVTLTASPAAGYVLGSLSARDPDGKVVDLVLRSSPNDIVSDMLWYTGTNTTTFTMPNSDVTVTPVFTNVMTAEGGLTVNMPNKATSSSISPHKYVTIPSGVTSFKVYDNGGADRNYSDGYNGYLTLTAPEGCVLQLSGTITTQSGSDQLTVLDGTDWDVSDFLLNHVSSTSDGVETAIPTVVSTGREIRFYFSSDASVNYAGLDLTVTVISPGTYYGITVTNADSSKGTMTASTASAQLGATVTLTATPQEGYVLSDLSVTSGGTAVKTDWNVWTNSATFKMPNGPVTVTPTFTNDLTSLAVNLPARSNKSVTIPEGVASFKIYDDGGPDGNYTPYCNGGLRLFASEGSLLRFTGSVAGPEDKIRMAIGDNRYTATKNDIDVTTSGDDPMFSLFAHYSDTGAGLDLTATVLYAVNVATDITNGTVTTDKANAAAGETVTLTVTPATGCTIGSVSINGEPLEAVGGVYSFTMPPRTVAVTATFRKLLTNADIAVADIPAQKYDGTALTPAITITDGETAISKGTDYIISPETATDAGNYTVTITGIGNYDGTTTKTFTVGRRAVTLTSASDSRAYDGTALTADGVTVGGDGFAQGEGATYDVTGTQTDVGSTDNTFTYTLNEGTKADNYDITTVEGTLTVSQLEGVVVTITGHSSTVDYDGGEHSVSGYDVSISNSIYTENDFTFSGDASATGTAAGNYPMGLAADDFANTNPNFAGVTFEIVQGGLTIGYYAATLADDADNASVLTSITENYGGKADVTLQGRTLYKDGDWNTLCLPFDVTLSGSVLDGAVARPLDAAYISSTTLHLTFGDAVATLVAGTPYIIKWAKADDYVDDDAHNIVNPVFEGVTVSTDKHDYDTAEESVTTDERVRFVGTYKSTAFDNDDTSILFVGAANTLYYPTTGAGIGTHRAYFKIGGDNQALPARRLTSFSIDFGDDDNTTGIISISSETRSNADAWYSLDGRKLAGKPTQNGIYINNGTKVVIK